MALYGRARTVLVVDCDATACFHVSNVLAKLGVTNRTEAVRLAIKNRLID